MLRPYVHRTPRASWTRMFGCDFSRGLFYRINLTNPRSRSDQPNKEPNSAPAKATRPRGLRRCSPQCARG